MSDLQEIVTIVQTSDGPAFFVEVEEAKKLLDEIERLRADASYQVACEWRDKYHAAETEIDQLRAVLAEEAADNDLMRSQLNLAVGRDEQTLAYLLAVAKAEIERLRAENERLCVQLRERNQHAERSRDELRMGL